MMRETGEVFLRKDTVHDLAERHKWKKTLRKYNARKNVHRNGNLSKSAVVALIFFNRYPIAWLGHFRLLAQP